MTRAMSSLNSQFEYSYKCEQNQSSSHFKLYFKYPIWWKSPKSRVSWLTKSADFGQKYMFQIQFKMRRTVILFAFITHFYNFPPKISWGSTNYGVGVRFSEENGSRFCEGENLIIVQITKKITTKLVIREHSYQF